MYNNLVGITPERTPWKQANRKESKSPLGINQIKKFEKPQVFKKNGIFIDEI